ncbi:MAG: YidC/Oxa1 family membrane protein insertase [Saccharofermentans sp.]|nr:YidC/Oxa1 family membrane protein insertase [Saccharofermentans sp.]
MAFFEVLRSIVLLPLELIFEVIFSIAYKITNSEGWAILLLSLAVSTLVLPLYKRAEKLEAEERDIEKKLEPVASHIKKSFKGDERYMILNTYYRQNHYNPLYQLRSSISVLLQIPFFMAAYDLLGTRALYRFNGKGFLFLSDLASPDGLLSIGDVTINALPFLMTLVNLVTLYIYSRNIPAKSLVASFILPFAFLVLLYDSPSGLLMYWTMNNVYSLFKTLIFRKISADKKKSPSKALSEHGVRPTVFILSGVFMSVLTGLLIPMAYLSTSPQEFIGITDPQNPLHYLLSSFPIAIGFFVFWMGIFYYLAGNKARKVMTYVLFAGSVASTLNYMLFGKDTGIINTNLIFDKAPVHPVSLIVLNAVIVLAVLGICAFLMRFEKAIGTILVAAILAMVTISVINIVKTQKAYRTVVSDLDTFASDTSPKITLSAGGKNVMVIMLDRAVSAYLPYAFNEFPELEEQFDGFVYYPNTASFGQTTIRAASALFGGYEYTSYRMDQRSDESLQVKHDEALRVMPVLFSNEGYQVTIMDVPFPGWTWNGDYSIFSDIDNCNCYRAKNYYSDSPEWRSYCEDIRNRNLFVYSLFRCSPLCLQDFIYDNGNYLSVMKEQFNFSDVLGNYKVLENLDDMTVIDNSIPGALLVMNNKTTHDVSNLVDFDPYNTYTFEEGYTISNGVSDLQITRPYQAATYECFVAAIRELGIYMDYLRQTGVYDNTKIIIVSDHGTGLGLFEDLMSTGMNAEWANPLLMIKDYDSTGFETDHTFMTNADVPTVAFDGIVSEPVNPATGNPINSELKDAGVYVAFSPNGDTHLWNPDYNNGNTFMVDEQLSWYRLDNEDIFVHENWVKVDDPEC